MHRSTGTHRRRRRAWVGITAVVAAVTLLGAGCAANPPYTVTVPGTYTIDFSAPTLSYPQGWAPVAKVVMCVNEPTAVALSSDFPLDQATVEWAGTTHTFPTPTLDPGCGTLRLVVPCCYVPKSVRITLSRV